jgi:hypothetical protein
MAQGQPEQAVRMSAAAAGIRASVGAPFSPYERATFERNVDAARDALGATAFDTLWAGAQAAPSEQIVEEVLSGL